MTQRAPGPPGYSEAAASDAMARARLERFDAEVEATPQYDPEHARVTLGFQLKARGNNLIVRKIKSPATAAGILLNESKSLGRAYEVLSAPTLIVDAWGERAPSAVEGQLAVIAGLPAWSLWRGFGVYTIQDHQILFVVDDVTPTKQEA